MDFGGPVWHASVVSGSEQRAEAVARSVLMGVGEPIKGEWSEKGGSAFHIRRRLSDDEQAVIGDARDIRGTDEEYRRMSALLSDAPHLRLLL